MFMGIARCMVQRLSCVLHDPQLEQHTGCAPARRSRCRFSFGLLFLSSAVRSGHAERQPEKANSDQFCRRRDPLGNLLGAVREGDRRGAGNEAVRLRESDTDRGRDDPGGILPNERRFSGGLVSTAMEACGVAGGRGFTQGQEVFTKAMCGTCHAFGRISQGNGISPDLTGVGSRYSRDVILDSILTPSLVLNSRFPATELRLRNGEVLTGTLVDLTDDKYVIAESPFHPEATTTIPRTDVILEQPSTTSPMPEGLLDSFTAEQIRDLFAFLDAQGDPDARVFKSVPAPKPIPPTQP